MLAEMEGAGVDRCVIVPPSWIGENNSTALEAAAAYPRRFAVMGRIDPTTSDVADRLATWRSQPGMLGVRFTFPGHPEWLDEDNHSLDAFWSAAERLGIPVMVFVPGYPGRLKPVAERHPGLTLVIDHLAANIQGKGADAFLSIDDLVGLAAYPKVCVKVSSAPSISANPFPYRDIQPFLRRIYDAFGARRLLWESDVTRLTSTYRECLDHIRTGLDFLSADDIEWIVGKTAAEVLNWPEVAP